MQDFIKSLVKRYDSLKTRRDNWDTHYQELADYMLPRKADIVRKRSRGEKRMEMIFDGTALQAVDLLSASLHGMLTSGATPWFHLDLKDADIGRDDEVREWLQDTSMRMMRAFGHSNFETEIHEMYVDLVVFGTGCMFVEMDDRDLRFSTRHISEFYVQENQFGIVDTVFRMYRLPARQAVQRFGIDNVGDYIAKKFKEKPDDEIDLLHAVVPRINRDPNKRDNKNMPFASFYIDMQTKMLLSESGFQEFPYIVPRFLKATGETMGRSPAMTALPDVKMLNLMSKTIIQAAQKQIDPPLLVPDDGFLLPIRTQPGGLNFFRSGTREMITPLNTGANIPIGLSMEEQRRTAIRSAFYVDQLLSGGAPNMTATEVVQRQEDMLQQPPEMIQGRDIDIEYVSPLARAQKSSSLNSTMKALEILMPLSQSIPVGDHIDADGLVKHVTEALGVPKTALKSEREVQQVREERAAQQQQQMEMMQEQQDIQNAGQLAQASRMVSK